MSANIELLFTDAIMSQAISQSEAFGEFPPEPLAPPVVRRSLPTEPLDERSISAALVRMGVVGSQEKLRGQALDGGVSSEIWRVEAPGRRACLKRARPQPKVAQQWEAPTIRNHHDTPGSASPGRFAHRRCRG